MEELRKAREDSATANRANSDSVPEVQALMCPSWVQSGQCSNGDACPRIHDERCRVLRTATVAAETPPRATTWSAVVQSSSSSSSSSNQEAPTLGWKSAATEPCSTAASTAAAPTANKENAARLGVFAALSKDLCDMLEEEDDVDVSTPPGLPSLRAKLVESPKARHDAIDAATLCLRSMHLDKVGGEQQTSSPTSWGLRMNLGVAGSGGHTGRV
eukprot:CAMPEP_0182461824 /NCGR_PEP_ID=MMETSP1319-20130603/6292_1 /TAXON_ID=172717 /ORGANISM="Bolidomonas pacifica, Strain RCC208" /LENGTH=214 /DNA_ID=CAMNT_0024661167 /DNA_START=207 /DNA_END=848 /DNA_ORIENTATION=-